MSANRAPLLGLVLAGGRSQRMGEDKGALVYPSVSALDQRRRLARALENVGVRAFLSCRVEQGIECEFPLIFDAIDGEGPGVGLLSAAQAHPEAAWLVIACDFPFVDESAIARLIEHRSREATLFAHANGIWEPLFTIWEPAALAALSRGFGSGDFSPRRALESIGNVTLVTPSEPGALINVNTPLERRERGL